MDLEGEEALASAPLSLPAMDQPQSNQPQVSSIPKLPPGISIAPATGETDPTFTHPTTKTIGNDNQMPPPSSISGQSRQQNQANEEDDSDGDEEGDDDDDSEEGSESDEEDDGVEEVGMDDSEDEDGENEDGDVSVL